MVERITALVQAGWSKCILVWSAAHTRPRVLPMIAKKVVILVTTSATGISRTLEVCTIASFQEISEIN